MRRPSSHESCAPVALAAFGQLVSDRARRNTGRARLVRSP